MLAFAASARLCLLSHCTLMHVVIRWRFPLADVLSSPGLSSTLPPPPSSETAALPNEVSVDESTAAMPSKLWGEGR